MMFNRAKLWVGGLAVAILLALPASSGFLNIKGKPLSVAAGDPVDFPLGTLSLDGPTTPEQIALYMNVTGSLSQSATATCLIKPTSGGSNTPCHNLYRIQPSLSSSGDETVVDAFAWPILDLTPGTSYDITVQVCVGPTCDTKNLTTTTRALPATAGAATVTITAGSSAATIEAAFNGAANGAVVQLNNGTYNVCTIDLTSGGTSGAPKYFHGQSRAGVIINCTDGSRGINISDDDIIIENFTLNGCATNYNSTQQDCPSPIVLNRADLNRVTVRDVTVNGFDGCFGFPSTEQGFQILFYYNHFVGNDPWNQAQLENNYPWSDDCIRVPGAGNAFFNNTLEGYGDTWALALSDGAVYSRDNFFYRNDVIKSLDDGVEFDYSSRNNAVYDNRYTNTSTFISCDPCYAGPVVAARNLVVNPARGPLKFQSAGSGMFVFNNTFIKTRGYWAVPTLNTSAESIWLNPDNGDQNSLAVVNNVWVYRGPGTKEIVLDNNGYNPADISHNSWYPDLVFHFKGNDRINLATLKADASTNSTPVFGASSSLFSSDNITVSNPWNETVTFPGANYQTEVTTLYDLTIANGDQAKNSGTVVLGITDGYTGVAPDRGHAIAGRTPVDYGDPSL